MPLLGASAVVAVGASLALAADHNEAGGTQADEISDIDDVYAWVEGTKAVAVLTFAGPGADPAAPPSAYDADVIYMIHIDNNGDLAPDFDILVRFGEDSLGDWGVQFENIPGSTGTVSGAVDTTIDAGNGLSAIAGVFDDPFFFDFTGLTDTLNSATVSFDSARDSFAGKNVNAIVVEMDLVTAANGDAMNIWATTGRK
jgi:hypothetical protein